jgi:hypothetical protein
MGKMCEVIFLVLKTEYHDDDDYLVLYLAVHDRLSVHSAYVNSLGEVCSKTDGPVLVSLSI